ncbi:MULTISPECIES: NACHT C-terminal helical domain 2-containing protein [unclassified Nostoc]
MAFEVTTKAHIIILLQQYYDVNKLLVDCLNSGAGVNPIMRK